jgi:hypothetical protein
LAWHSYAVLVALYDNRYDLVAEVSESGKIATLCHIPLPSLCVTFPRTSLMYITEAKVA